MIGHRVGPNDGFFVGHLQIPQTELIPFALEGIRVLVVLRVGCDVDVLVVDYGFRHVHLDVATGLKVQRFTFRQTNDKLLDERGDVVVRNHLALPLLDAEHFFGDLDLHVLFDLHLATQAPVVSDFFTGEMRLFCRQNGPATFTYLASALDTGPAATACGRQEDTVVAQRREQRASAVYLQGLFPVDYDGHFATGRKFGLRKQQQSDQ